MPDNLKQPLGPIVLSCVSQDSYTVCWVKPNISESVENFQGFVVESSSDNVAWTKIADLDKNATSYTVEKYDKNSSQFIRVLCQYEAGRSSPLTSCDLKNVIAAKVKMLEKKVSGEEKLVNLSEQSTSVKLSDSGESPDNKTSNVVSENETEKPEASIPDSEISEKILNNVNIADECDTDNKDTSTDSLSPSPSTLISGDSNKTKDCLLPTPVTAAKVKGGLLPTPAQRTLDQRTGLLNVHQSASTQRNSDHNKPKESSSTSSSQSSSQTSSVTVAKESSGSSSETKGEETTTTDSEILPKSSHSETSTVDKAKLTKPCGPLMVVSATPQRFSVKWSMPSAQEPGLKNFLVEKSTDSSTWTKVAETHRSTCVCSISSYTVGDDQFVRVFAVYDTGSSDPLVSCNLKHVIAAKVKEKMMKQSSVKAGGVSLMKTPQSPVSHSSFQQNTSRQVGSRNNRMQPSSPANESRVSSMGDIDYREPLRKNDEHFNSSQKLCQFWPNCERGRRCPFIHPDRQCPDWPNCRQGANCPFFHPRPGAKRYPPDASDTAPPNKIVRSARESYNWQFQTEDVDQGPRRVMGEERFERGQPVGKYQEVVTGGRMYDETSGRRLAGGYEMGADRWKRMSEFGDKWNEREVFDYTSQSSQSASRQADVTQAYAQLSGPWTQSTDRRMDSGLNKNQVLLGTYRDEWQTYSKPEHLIRSSVQQDHFGYSQDTYRHLDPSTNRQDSSLSRQNSAGGRQDAVLHRHDSSVTQYTDDYGYEMSAPGRPADQLTRSSPARVDDWRYGQRSDPPRTSRSEIESEQTYRPSAYRTSTELRRLEGQFNTEEKRMYQPSAQSDVQNIERYHSAYYPDRQEYKESVTKEKVYSYPPAYETSQRKTDLYSYEHYSY